MTHRITRSAQTPDTLQDRITRSLTVTSNLALAEAPGNVRLSKSDAGLPKASVVNVSQVLTIDRALLTLRVKALPNPAMQRVDEGLRLVLGL